MCVVVVFNWGCQEVILAVWTSGQVAVVEGNNTFMRDCMDCLPGPEKVAHVELTEVAVGEGMTALLFFSPSLSYFLFTRESSEYVHV